MLKKIQIQINGVHCKSCKTLIETEIDILPGINRVYVDHVSGQTEIELDDVKANIKDVFKEIKKLNYEPVFSESDTKSKDNNQATGFSEFKDIALGALIPLGIAGLIGGYLLIQNFGGFELLSKLNEGNVSYGIIFIIGILTGFHCIGMCGGLVVAYSTKSSSKKSSTSAQDCKDQCLKNKETCLVSKESLIPHFQYNTGRFISYAAVGGILGGAGSFFAINPTFTGSLIIFSGIFMFLMGLSFIYNWQILDSIKLRTPQFIARFLYNQKHSKKPKGPLAIGLLNGFMPCGPLQAMQLYALASGTMLAGATSMAIYALGTIPLMLGFGAFLSMISKNYIKRITKISGVLVIILGLFMANRGLASFGYNIGNLTFDNNAGNQEIVVADNNKEYQEVRMELGYFGYKPNVLYIKRGMPVRWIIDVKQMSGCTNAIMIESLGIEKDLRQGENIIEFTPPNNVSEIKFSCWMRMVWGKFVVTDDDYIPTAKDVQKEVEALPKGQGCGGGTGGCGCGSGRS